MADNPLPEPVAESTLTTDIPMEDVSAQAAEPGLLIEGKGGDSEAVKEEAGGDSEAAALLLGIASAIEERPTSSDGILVKDAAEPEETVQPSLPDSAFPYTPPDDQSITGLSTLPTSSISHLLSVAIDSPPTSLQASIPTTDSSGPSTKPKAKRKRQSAPGPSRRRSNDPSLPHFLGEDNQQIRCICGFNDDDGFTIQCERCYAWQHGQCFGFFHEGAAPDTYFCELCEPRQVDRDAARQRQMQRQIDRQAELQDILRISRGPTPRKPSGIKPDRASDPDRGKHRKPKRARTGSVMEGEEEPRDVGKDGSPGAMGPPTVKPKRKTGPKPRSAKSTMVDSAPGPLIREASVVPAQTMLTAEDELFFLINPWEMEFTPIRDHIVRGKVARQRMAALYREWVDLFEEEEMTSPRRIVTNPSGLPSPTETGVVRLSPEALFPQPDFSILAPPIPPVFLAGYDADIEIAETTIQAIEDSNSFLPLEYTETLDGKVYSRPALYGVFAKEEISSGKCIGEYLGEVVDCETYRRDPINQYAGLGIPKPHVRSVAPPVNLIIDARGYGNHLRFVRSACHPNAVLRPILRQNGKGASPKLTFGIFASGTIAPNEEISLAWEWDDQHIVHSLRTTVMACMFNDGSVSRPTHNLADPTMRAVRSKYAAVLDHFLGSFSSCACRVKGNCAIAQMIGIVRPERPKHANAQRKRSNLGELVGAFRGWRRREVEAEQARKWKIKVELGDDSFAMASPEDYGGYPMEVDEIVVTPQKEEADEPLPDLRLPPDDLAKHPPSSSLTSAPSPRSFPGPRQAVSVPTQDEVEQESEDDEEDDEDVSMPSADEEDDDEGSLSDATTATQPKSHFSEDETESENEDVATPIEHTGHVRVNGNSKAVRRVLSPVADANIISEELLEKLVKGPSRFVKTETLENGKPQRSGKPAKANGSRLSRSKANRRMSSPTSSTGEELSITSPSADTARVPSPVTVKLEPRAVVPDQVAAPLGEPTEISLAPNSAAVEEFAPTEEAKLDIAPTPPREPTPPPPRPITPPPKKVVSMSEYLKSFRIKKDTLHTVPDSVPDSAGGVASPPQPAEATQEKAPSPPPEVASSVPEVSAIAPTAPGVVPPVVAATPSAEVAAKVEYDAAGNRFNLNSFLPAGPRSAGTPAAATPSFQPRQDYFPTPSAPIFQASPSPAFQPRNASTSFTPRTASHTPTDEGSRAMGISFPPHQYPTSPDEATRPGFVRPPPPFELRTQLSFTPRAEQSVTSEMASRSDHPAVSNFVPRPNGFTPTPPKPTLPLPSEQTSPTVPISSMPSVLPVRDPPPHQTQTSPNTVAAPTGPSAERKLPPTGPRAQVAPPTGPKGVRGLPPASPVPRGPIDVTRGGFGGAPRGYGRGGGGLGRGGFGLGADRGSGFGGDRDSDRDGAGAFGGRGMWRGRAVFPPRGRGRGG